jgi:alpha-1,6-mannosyltransferase
MVQETVTGRGRGSLALVALTLVALPLAAPGPGRLVPAALASSPRWLLGITGRGFGLGGKTYLGLLVAAFVCYLVVVAAAGHIRPRVLWTAIVALVALFTLAPPLLSRDVFSYIAYGRLGARHGLDPYVAVPAQRPNDPVFPFVGWRNAPGAYGPLFTFAVYPIGLLPVAVAMWVLKIVGGLAVLALAAVTAHIAKVRGGDPQRAAAMLALNPLVLVHVVGGAHNDSLLMLALMGSVAMLVSGRQVRGAVALALAVGLKTSGLVAAPFALAGSRPRRVHFVSVLAVSFAVIGGVAFAAFGSHAWAAERLAGQNQSLTSHYSVPSTLARLTTVSVDRVRILALAGYAAAVLGLLWWTRRGGDWVRATGWAAFGLLVASSWLMPWYVIWALPLAAVARDRRLTGGVLGLCAFQLVNRLPI